MFSTSDTIVAIATPPGRGGIGVVRLSGPLAQTIAMALLARTRWLAPRHATFGTIFATIRGTESPGARAEAMDQVIACSFPAPASYTGDDVVEISAHGSPVVLRGIVAAATARGARLAEPGEFTLRAYVNGRLDLMQAEAVGDLIDAVTPLQARTAFDQLQGTLTRAIGEIDRSLFDLIARLEASVDFPDEGYHFVDPLAVAAEIDEMVNRAVALLDQARRGRLVREGFDVAIVGRPNVGKSSLFNALVGSARAIVTPVPGTTRDLVTETIDIDGIPVTLIDTAGLRATSDVVELEGVARSRSAAVVADLVLLVVDGSERFDISVLDDVQQDIDNKELIAINKIDLADAASRATSTREASLRRRSVAVSARTGEGLSALRHAIAGALDVKEISDPPAITNVRHIALVERARNALLRARQAAMTDGRSLPEEFVLADLQEARAAFEEVSGKRAPEDLLEHIFSRFCVGK